MQAAARSRRRPPATAGCALGGRLVSGVSRVLLVPAGHNSTGAWERSPSCRRRRPRRCVLLLAWIGLGSREAGRKTALLAKDEEVTGALKLHEWPLLLLAGLVYPLPCLWHVPGGDVPPPPRPTTPPHPTPAQVVAIALADMPQPGALSPAQLLPLPPSSPISHAPTSATHTRCLLSLTRRVHGNDVAHHHQHPISHTLVVCWPALLAAVAALTIGPKRPKDAAVGRAPVLHAHQP